jgi:UPF0755 protein
MTVKTKKKVVSKKKVRRKKGLKTGLLLAFLGFLLLGGGLFSLAYEALRQPVFLAEPVTLEIAPGTRFRQIAFMLAEKGIWVHPYLMAVYAKLNQLDGKIKAGYYQFEGSLQPIAVLDELVAGNVKPFQVSLIEGQTFDQWLQKLRSIPQLKQTLTEKTQATARLKRQLGIKADNLEGWFYPDTYQFAPGSTDLDILLRAHRAMQEALTTAWAQRSANLPYQSSYEALIMASIIEKETAQSSERAKISAVFLNRLRLDMRLQTDPTVIYGLGDEYQGNLTREHLKRPTPYNTYLNKGLPPTPIAMVSSASLNAALHPETTEALYFVASNDGYHVFSTTLKDHNDAVRRYQLSPESP